MNFATFPLDTHPQFLYSKIIARHYQQISHLPCLA